MPITAHSCCASRIWKSGKDHHGIIGPNGSGKTTLLKLMSFMEKCRSGEICFRGRPAQPFAREVRSRVTAAHPGAFFDETYRF